MKQILNWPTFLSLRSTAVVCYEILKCLLNYQRKNINKKGNQIYWFYFTLVMTFENLFNLF